MNGAPVASQFGGCLWTAGGDMVCTKKAKQAYYKNERRTEINEARNQDTPKGKKQRKESFVHENDQDEETF